MPTLTLSYRDDAERLILEQAIAYATHLHQLAQDAPDGSVLETCEKLALDKGRSLLRDTLATALEGRIASAEQKGGSPASVPRRTPDAPRADTRATS
jgi:hypothetical protein